MFTLSAQYRSPLNFSRDSVEQAHASLVRLYTARDNMVFLLGTAGEGEPTEADRAFMDRVDEGKRRFEAGMDDDLNTAEAVAALFDIVYAANPMVNPATSASAIRHALDTLKSLADILGLMVKQAGELTGEVQELAQRRVQARKDKDWKQSDALRAQIIALGYTVEDTASGQKITKAL